MLLIWLIYFFCHRKVYLHSVWRNAALSDKQKKAIIDQKYKSTQHIFKTEMEKSPGQFHISLNKISYFKKLRFVNQYELHTRRIYIRIIHIIYVDT